MISEKKDMIANTNTFIGQIESYHSKDHKWVKDCEKYHCQERRHAKMIPDLEALKKVVEVNTERLIDAMIELGYIKQGTFLGGLSQTITFLITEVKKEHEELKLYRKFRQKVDRQFLKLGDKIRRLDPQYNKDMNHLLGKKDD